MEILDTNELVEAYKNIIAKAEDFLVLACPYFDEKEEQNFANDVLELLEKNTSVKKILFIYRKKAPDSKWKNGIDDENFEKIKTSLMKNKNSDVFLLAFENLHAKAVISKNKAMICSLNLTDCSVRNSNFEIGVSAYNRKNSSKEDLKCYKEICLIIASFYNTIAKEKLEEYKDKTRNANKKGERTYKEYDVRDNLEILNDIDPKKLFFGEEEDLSTILYKCSSEVLELHFHTKDLSVVKYPYKTS